MADIRIPESDMTFVVDEDQLYHLEKSVIIDKMPQGTKTPEFIMYNHDQKRLVMVEAKKSAPRTDNSEDFDKWIGEIIEKFSTAMHLFHAISLKRHPEKLVRDLGSDFGKLKLGGLDYRFILVVKNHKREWMPDLMNYVKKKMNPLVKWWNISDPNVKVINEDTARQWNLII